MEKIKWTTKMLADLQTLEAIHDLTETYFNYLTSTILLTPLVIINGLSVIQTSGPSGQVIITSGNGIGANGEIIMVGTNQTANVLSGTATPPAQTPPPITSWDNGQSAIADRHDIVAINFTTYDDQSELTWFENNSVTPPTFYQTPVNKRTFDFYTIRVFHGTTPGVDPTIPTDYIPLARITITALDTAITTAKITQLTLPIAGTNTSLLDFLKHHKHKGQLVDGTDKVDYNDLLNTPSPPAVSVTNIADAIISNSDATTYADITAATKFFAYYAP
jgi:hypothetical protein